MWGRWMRWTLRSPAISWQHPDRFRRPVLLAHPRLRVRVGRGAVPASFDENLGEAVSALGKFRQTHVRPSFLSDCALPPLYRGGASHLVGRLQRTLTPWVGRDISGTMREEEGGRHLSWFTWDPYQDLRWHANEIVAICGFFLSSFAYYRDRSPCLYRISDDSPVVSETLCH
jgi:hypothetical protein